MVEEPGREPGRCGFESRRPPHGELSRWCAPRPVKPSPRHWWFDSTLTDSCPRGLAEGHRFPKPADTGSSPVGDARMYLVVCPSGQGSACKAEHAGSNPAAASEWPVAQWTEQRFPKPHCAGSSPAGPAIGHFPLWICRKDQRGSKTTGYRFKRLSRSSSPHPRLAFDRQPCCG